MIGDGRTVRWQGWFTPPEGWTWGDPGRVFELPASLDRDAGAGHDDGAQLSGGSERVSELLARKEVGMGSLLTGDIEVLEVEGQAQPVREVQTTPWQQARIEEEVEGMPLFWELAREMGLPGTLLSGVDYQYLKLGEGFRAGGKALMRTAIQVGVLPMATVQANDEARQRAADRTARGDVRVEASDSTGVLSHAPEGTGVDSEAAERTNALEHTGGQANAPQNTHGEGDEALDTTLGLLMGMRGLSDEKVRDLIEAWEDEGGSFAEG